MKVLFLAAEAEPFVKVGGLADVAGSLPAALRALGHDVRLVIPGYGALDWARWKPRQAASFDVPYSWGAQRAVIWETESGGVPVFLVTGPPIPSDSRIYGARIDEDAPKFIFFSLAALFSAQTLGWQPDVVHANDWHTGAAAWWLATAGRVNDYFRSAASVFTIHNLLYRGEGSGRHLADYGAPVLEAARALPDGFRDSPLALALLSANMLSTVSPTYAREILTPFYGEGLDAILRARQDRLAGILNGIDRDFWNPAGGEGIPSRFDANTLEDRAPNKAALQAEAGLPIEPRTPLLAVVSRLDPQKGLAIAVPAVRRWLARGGQFFLLGTGQPALEQEFAAIERDHPGRASVRLRFDPGFARTVYAGADMILIPSRYEPCGLTQMIAMRYGAVPVARRTGGLADTITDTGDLGGTGFLFDDFHPGALDHALDRAVSVYAQPAQWSEIQRRGMRKDFSWSRSAPLYVELYERARSLKAG
ncbi:MAG TPA: glycogen/starch synthase [Thermoanaerobaculia bacterium]|nr:glycogen/starch synthase [Thermoanaerobaculia bacterium]